MDDRHINKNTRIKEGKKNQIFLKDKVYIGTTGEILRRRRFNTRRKGKTVSIPYYTNEDMSFRIKESMLINYLNFILTALTEVEDTSVVYQNSESKKQQFLIEQRIHIKKINNLDEYKNFINECLNQDDNQMYLNHYVKRKIEAGQFKNIIEKIEIYETGLVCILNNGFEMSVRF